MKGLPEWASSAMQYIARNERGKIIGMETHIFTRIEDVDRLPPELRAAYDAMMAHPGTSNLVIRED